MISAAPFESFINSPRIDGARIPRNTACESSASIPQTLAAIARQLGVAIHYGVKVRRILCAGGRVTSVETETGERWPAAAILSNARLVPNAALPGSRYCGLESHQALAEIDSDRMADLQGSEGADGAGEQAPVAAEQDGAGESGAEQPEAAQAPEQVQVAEAEPEAPAGDPAPAAQPAEAASEGPAT